MKEVRNQFEKANFHFNIICSPNTNDWKFQPHKTDKGDESKTLENCNK